MTRIIVLAACTLVAVFIGYMIAGETGMYVFGAATAVGLVVFGRRLAQWCIRQF